MRARLDQIRELLNELEADPEANTTQPDGGTFCGLELPIIVQEIVDDLQPLLSPYEVAFYWYLFRHSIAENGNPLLRVSTRGLQSGVMKPSRSETISLTQVRETLAALETFGAIRKDGEPNRDGTLYRVFIPDEIEACRKFQTERKAAEPTPEVTASEIDFYNVRENRFKVYERDGYKCCYCEKQLTRFTVTLDHVKPIVGGGDNSFDNLVTACLNCNSRKHQRPVGDFLAER